MEFAPTHSGTQYPLVTQHYLYSCWKNFLLAHLALGSMQLLFPPLECQCFSATTENNDLSTKVHV